MTKHVVASSSAPRLADEAVGRSAVRKASWRLLPLIALGYGMAFMDRVNISFAALQMNRDLHFSATVYGFGAGLFFVSYAACEIPSNLLLLRFGARRWLARIMVTWGALAVAMMFVRTPGQFYVARFFLGMAEAGFFPGVLYYLMQWFPPDMRARAVSRFYVSLPLSSVVMGLLAGALLNLQGRLGLAGWQWLCLVEGLPPIALGIVFLFCLPDTPAHAAWLDPEEQEWLLTQIREDAAAGAHTEGVGRALLDRRVWQLGVLCLCLRGSIYAYTFSAPVILKKLTGFSVTNVGFLIAAMNLLGGAGMILNAIHSDRARERYWHVIVPFLVITAGYFVSGLSMLPWLAVPALAVAVINNSSLEGPLLSIPAIFLKGRGAAAGIAAMNTIGMLGGFLGPYWMGLARDLTGDYQRGLLTLTIPSLAAAAIMFAMHRSSQRQRDAAAG
ncbi:MFS transporter [Edaphobacter bradus]|uniref:MFS transporter n=1 Tax=Edaphobacter bradus TaxID=2259016 RepID=UPI0021DF60E8|nr:MFS transporter [Edaphobacter bradus]